MKRRLLAVSALAFVLVLSGCTVFGGSSEIDEGDLLDEAEYEWETNATATFFLDEAPLLSLSSDRYQAVVQVEGNESVTIHRDRTFRGDDSVAIRALQFRFPNGTVVNATHQNLTAVEHSDTTEISLPAENGTVAYTAEWGASSWGSYGRTWRTPTFVEGSYAVNLPEGARVGIPFLSRVVPGGSERTVENDRTRIFWEDPDSSTILIRYYLTRDLYLLGTIVTIIGTIGIVGTVYYYRQIKRARKKRQNVGFDIPDDEDDSFGGDGPPPGFR